MLVRPRVLFEYVVIFLQITANFRDVRKKVLSTDSSSVQTFLTIGTYSVRNVSSDRLVSVFKSFTIYLSCPI